MESRPLPGGGYQHQRLLSLTNRPPAAFEDSVVALANLEAGWQFPLVEVTEESEHSFTVLVSVFGEGPEPTAQEKADIAGCAAELHFADGGTARNKSGQAK